MNRIIELYENNNQIKQVKKHIMQESYALMVDQAALNHRILTTAMTYFVRSETIVYVASNVYKAQVAYDLFGRLVGFDSVNLWMVDEMVSTDLLAVSKEFKYERIHTLVEWYEQKSKIIVTHPQALLRPLMPKEQYIKGIRSLLPNATLDTSSFLEYLVHIGYQRTPTTTVLGDFSVRGEVIDLFSPFYDAPIRINLFDTEIERIRHFDPITQKSTITIDEAIVFPIDELIYDEDTFLKVEKTLEKHRSVYSFIEDTLKDLKTHTNNERLQKYIGYFYNHTETILEYLEKKTVFYEDYARIKENYEQLVVDYFQHKQSVVGASLFNWTYFLEFERMFINCNRQVFFSEFSSGIPPVPLNEIYKIGGHSIIDYQNDLKNFVLDVKANQDKTFIIAVSSEERGALVTEILQTNQLTVTPMPNAMTKLVSGIYVVYEPKAIAFGFLSTKLEVITEKELFKEFKFKKTKYRQTYQHTIAISSKEDLVPGEYVVHYDYGVAKYIGIKTVPVRDVINDYIVLQYENMELYIPVEKVTLLDKYIGSEGVVPKLTKLGTSEWNKKKARIQEKLEDIAKDLLDTQIAREQNKGHRYEADNEIQRMFEDDFLYEETLDQKRTVAIIKEDMEQGKIVDRLICGDVGYGKTEIAMRIACKTVFSYKQVAYLAPTTILTRQHYYTFKDRFEKYGIRIELLNRLIPLKKQEEILQDIKEGKVDIVIGTHRLLSDDVVFADLGLLVVDEEQRFGVLHKEKIKQMKKNINVLTLTATPIPRTLQMSIMGVRQMSLIETPPQDRYPVQTYVLEENEIAIKEAVYRELSRGGQVFYLHNRIRGLDRLGRKLQRLIPEARIVIAHGQMDREQLEDAIQAFIDREFDILLCTTIIETGIDIPNTNTLIIDNADQLGLSQIYQIRGRVGRSDKVAYAYLFYEEDKVLTSTGEKRLSAIKEFTNLGSGYKIAVRDLAIRGAGDILGKEQSGFIDAIGMEMYMKMLNEAIEKVQGIKKIEEKTYQIDVSRHVSPTYVQDDNIIIYIHKEISKIETKEDKQRVIEDCTDRFGRLNEDILLYIEERYLESMMRKVGVMKVHETANNALIRLNENQYPYAKTQHWFLESYAISNRFGFEYKGGNLLIRVSKKGKDKSWIYQFSMLFERMYEKGLI